MSSDPPPRRSMERIENLSNLQVTFSKRWSSIFKKANELCTLTGAEAAVAVFSPSNKAYSFGHPNVDTIVDRFSHQNPPNNDNNIPQFPDQGSSNMRYTHVQSVLETTRKRGKELNEIRNAEMQPFYPSSGELDSQQLYQLIQNVKNLGNSIESLYMQSSSNAMNPYCGGNVAYGDPHFGIGASGSYATAQLDQGTNGENNVEDMSHSRNIGRSRGRGRGSF